MRIGIDARFIGPKETGLGKYIEKLIENLQRIDNQNQYSLFLRKSNWDYLKLTGKRFEKSLADVKWYSLEEQIRLPKIFARKNLDLLHVPHFNTPIFYRGKFIVTIHDLIHHHFKEQSATTKNPILFNLKRLGYRFIISNSIKNSQKIIVPSNFVKEQIVESFKIPADKVVVTYEAAEEEYFEVNHQLSTITQQPFLLYVGNAYPHKNLNRLLDALLILSTHHSPPTTNLIIVCPRDIFAKRLTKEINARNLKKRVILTGYQTTEKLKKLFNKASAYVFPSLSEGFGIPGLDAMAANLPVVAANIPTLKEIYGDAAHYFDPFDPQDIAEKIQKVLQDSKTRSLLASKAEKQVKKYSWLKMAEETLKIYESV